MKHRKTYLFVIVFTLLGGIGTFVYMQGSATPLLKFSLNSEKTNYKLGEPISFIFELKNDSDNEVQILDGFNVGVSDFQVEVSTDGENFTACNGYGWGQLDAVGGEPKLSPNQTLTTPGRLLWILSAQNLPIFRFKEPGNYTFRARYNLAVENKDANAETNITKMTLESKPITIKLEEPQGEDLEVWNLIKDDGNFAYFIQTNNLFLPLARKEEREIFKQKVETIIVTHPNSLYSESLRKSLDKFNLNKANP